MSAAQRIRERCHRQRHGAAQPTREQLAALFRLVLPTVVLLTKHDGAQLLADMLEELKGLCDECFDEAIALMDDASKRALAVLAAGATYDEARLIARAGRGDTGSRD